MGRVSLSFAPRLAQATTPRRCRALMVGGRGKNTWGRGSLHPQVVLTGHRLIRGDPCGPHWPRRGRPHRQRPGSRL
eukprot:scaffold218615_cov30-Tisochrysis_lutea.AAC.1